MPGQGKTPPLEIRLSVLAAVDYAPGTSIRERIKSVSRQHFVDQNTGQHYQFTWRTISTWLYRYKKNGVATLEKKTRCYFPNSHRNNQSIPPKFTS